MAKRLLAIMQGRLLPPQGGRIQAFPAGRWAEELPRARAAGLAAIEWIYETYGREDNPLCTDEGIGRLRRLSAEHDVQIRSVCADYFMEHPLVRASPAERDERSDHLKWLLARCAAAGIGRVVLPFVDQSDVRTAREKDELVETLQAVVPEAEASGVELHLEMALPPAPFAAFLDRLPHRMLRVNYDSGNSASLGYDVASEFAAYGGRIGSVHIKDRVRGGTTVPLGTGDTDFPALFRGLDRLGYAGDLVLQVARGTDGEEVEWARQNRALVEAWLA